MSNDVATVAQARLRSQVATPREGTLPEARGKMSSIRPGFFAPSQPKALGPLVASISIPLGFRVRSYDGRIKIVMCGDDGR